MKIEDLSKKSSEQISKKPQTKDELAAAAAKSKKQKTKKPLKVNDTTGAEG
jgi:hypothetical protein